MMPTNRESAHQTTSPGGTINFSVFDDRNLVTAVYVGTNATGATETDPTGGGAAGNNMVVVTQNEYDNGVAGRDGNLTSTWACRLSIKSTACLCR